LNKETNEHATARLGMWIFLATEVMLFGGLFTVYTIYHGLFHDAFALASRRMDFWLGTINTAVLLISSLTMVLSVRAAKQAQRKTLLKYLALTILLGTCFVGIKAVEYTGHIRDGLLPGRHFVFQPGLTPSPPGTELFFCLYFIMTGLHAFHMLIGIGLLSFLSARVARFHGNALSPIAVEMSGLYWHFIDVVWIFLFPLFYLIGGH
jgi:cytochrome c oxidase subunit 3